MNRKIFFIVVVLLILIPGIGFYINTQHYTDVSVVTSPTEATIIVNGKSAKTPTVLKNVKKGTTLTIQASKENHYTVTETFSVTTNRPTFLITLPALISPVNQQGDIVAVGAFTPMDKQTNVAQNSKLSITLVGDVKESDIQVELSPETAGAFKWDDSIKTMTFTPQYGFRSLTTYTAKLTVENKRIAYKQVLYNRLNWTFTTEEQQGETGFTKKEYEEFIQQRNHAISEYEARKKRLPFLVLLPYATERFKVSIYATSDTVIITTFGRNPQEALLYREEAKKWLTANGGTIETLSIQYTNQAP